MVLCCYFRVESVEYTLELNCIPVLELGPMNTKRDRAMPDGMDG